jgi:hypothetical protein
MLRETEIQVLGRLLAGVEQACGQKFYSGDVRHFLKAGYNTPLSRAGLDGYSFEVTSEIREAADACKAEWEEKEVLQSATNKRQQRALKAQQAQIEAQRKEIEMLRMRNRMLRLY